MENNQIWIQLAADLAGVAVRNTASIVTSKISTIKAKKNDKEAISKLEEIILELISDKAEVERIAKSYQQELVSQRITEKEIEYITNNLFPILNNFIPPEKHAELNQIKSLLSSETLTILQLLGFNYKRAIGDPLTNLLKRYIESKMPSDNELSLTYVLKMAEIAKDEESTKRYISLMDLNK